MIVPYYRFILYLSNHFDQIWKCLTMNLHHNAPRVVKSASHHRLLKVSSNKHEQFMILPDLGCQRRPITQVAPQCMIMQDSLMVRQVCLGQTLKVYRQ